MLLLQSETSAQFALSAKQDYIQNGVYKYTMRWLCGRMYVDTKAPDPLMLEACSKVCSCHADKKGLCRPMKLFQFLRSLI